MLCSFVSFLWSQQMMDVYKNLANKNRKPDLSAIDGSQLSHSMEKIWIYHMLSSSDVFDIAVQHYLQWLSKLVSGSILQTIQTWIATSGSTCDLYLRMQMSANMDEKNASITKKSLKYS